MGPVRFDVDFVKNAFNEAERTNNATFNDRANDAVFISYNGTAGEYIRITFGDATSRLALKDTGSLAGHSTVKSTDPIRIDHGSPAVEIHIRRRLGLSQDGGPIFGTYDIQIADAGEETGGGGTFIPLSVGGPGGSSLVFEC
jgi:hypothetical protein